MKEHTQIIKFVDGSKKTIENVVKVVEGDMTKLTNNKGVEYLINKTHVLWVIRGTGTNQVETTTRGYNLNNEEDYDEPVSESEGYT